MSASPDNGVHYIGAASAKIVADAVYRRITTDHDRAAQEAVERNQERAQVARGGAR